MKKVLLIKPSNQKLYNTPNQRKDEPLGLEYLAAMIRDKHQVSILDLDVVNYSDDELGRYLAEAKPDIVGITAATPMVNDAAAVFRIVATHSPASLKVIGGPHATALPLDTLKYTDADVAIMGEGEYSFQELVNGADLEQIQGIAYKDNDMFRENERRPLIADLDALPLPAHDLVPRDAYQLNPYFEAYYHDSLPKLSATVTTSRGCPYQCTYCASKQTFGSKIRFRSPDNVIAELEYLNKELNVRSLIFIDDCFTADKKRTVEICRKIIQNKIDVKWRIDTRVNLVDAEILQIMKEAGCRFIIYGVEAGNQRVLNSIKKGTSVEQIKAAFRLTHKVGIDTQANFMLGHLDETEEEVLDSIRLAKELDCTRASFYLVLPLPGSVLYKQTLERGFAMEDFSRFMWYKKPVSAISRVPEGRLKELQDLAYDQVPSYSPRFV